MTRLKEKYIGIISILFISASSYAGDTQQTAPKHYLHNCIECHAKMTGGNGEVLYRRKDSLINTLSDLRKRVDFCQQGSSQNWSTEEIEQVVQYLNTYFYNMKL